MLPGVPPAPLPAPPPLEAVIAAADSVPAVAALAVGAGHQLPCRALPPTLPATCAAPPFAVTARSRCG
jgi:hypothetical protein